ncbi:MAG: tetratricopeptide repeat protein [Candidatus Binataceae bacterium]
MNANRAAPTSSSHRALPGPRWFRLAAAGLALLTLSGVVWELSRPDRKGPVTTPHLAAQRLTFVGSKACGVCHLSEFKSWQGSHHQLAMQAATDATVLGDFAHAQFSDAGVTSTFFREDGKFMVRTGGPGGAPHDYQIKFTFGVSPLQQYLIAFPGGRLQAFGIAWDSRPRAAGGQRWFALYPGAQPSDPRYWTALDQNWNYMCADCHSTNVRKNYDSRRRTYATTYAEIDVGCEACHGPGSGHVAWARHPRAYPESASGSADGLTIALDARAGVSWRTDRSTGEVRRSKPLNNDREVELCARCHSRRAQIHEDYVHGQPLGDDYRVALLDKGLYFPDGQIEGEVYEYGSFIQSRMSHAGVTCSDCHDPHSGRLRAEGNHLCTRCHLARKYDSPRHFHHPAGSTGSRCVECHMPSRTYMRIDRRRDHSIRIPRPDLSVTLGTPNACNNCHFDKNPQWAADYVAKWYRGTPIGFQRFGPALAAGRMGAPGAQAALIELIANPAQPAIARATAIKLLATFNSVAEVRLREHAEDASALVRRATADGLATPTAAPSIMVGLLNDPVRAVRIEAAESLAGVPLDALPEDAAAALERASAQYVAAQKLNADRPEAHLDLGTFFTRQGRFASAKRELKTALSIDPSFSPAAVNLADLERELGHDQAGEAVLRQALQRTPSDASLLYALGLWYVRQKRSTEALALFARAARLAPSDSRYAYVYAIALNSAGDTKAAIAVLEHSVKLHPYDRDALAALVSFCDRTNDQAKASRYARVLDELAAPPAP